MNIIKIGDIKIFAGTPGSASTLFHGDRKICLCSDIRTGCKWVRFSDQVKMRGLVWLSQTL